MTNTRAIIPSEPIKTRQAKAARESAAGKSAALRSLLEASMDGGALHGAGVCGRLGDLGVIGAEYDAAVSSLFRLQQQYLQPFRAKVHLNIKIVFRVNTSCCFRAEKVYFSVSVIQCTER